MESATENFNNWRVSDLKQFLLQYNISDVDIEGSGKNSNVVKKDYVRTASLLTIKEYNYQDINEDVWYNILIHLKYHDLKKTCLTAKSAIKICNNISFWKDKFQKENLTIVGKMPMTIKEWIKKYKKASYASLIANKIVNVLKHNPKYTISAFFELNFDMSKIIPQYEENIKKARRQFGGKFLAGQGFSIKMKNGLQFKFFYINNNGSEPGKFKTMITYDQLYLILYYYLHYFSPKELNDQNDLSYDLDDLNDKFNKRKQIYKNIDITLKETETYRNHFIHLELLEEKIKLLSF